MSANDKLEILNFCISAVGWRSGRFFSIGDLAIETKQLDSVLDQIFTLLK